MQRLKLPLTASKFGNIKDKVSFDSFEKTNQDFQPIKKDYKQLIIGPKNQKDVLEKLKFKFSNN